MSQSSTRFAEFWVIYPAGPRKVNKRGCEQKWKARKLDGIADVILSGLRKWIHSQVWQEKDGAFIPMPATWLNQDRWEAADMLPKAIGMAAVDSTMEYLDQQSLHTAQAATVAPDVIDRAKQVRQRLMEQRLHR
jgi:hypothetical protein